MCKAGNLFHAVRSLKSKTMIKTIMKSGLGTTLGNLASMPFNFVNMAIQSNMHKDLMNLQQKLNLQSFERQIASTSIGSQVKRLKALGLNPALALGSGVGSMSGQVGGTSLTGVDPSHPYVMSPAEVSQIENIDANTEKTNEETVRLKTQNLYQEDILIAELNDKKADFLVKLSQKDLNESEKKHYEKSIEELDARISESKSRRDKIAQDIAESKERTKNYSYQRAELGATTAQKKEETRQLKENADVIRQGLVANVDLADSQREYYLWLADKAELEGNMIEKELETYNINLYARLAKMSSEELRGWFSSVEKYNERMDEARKNGEVSKNYKRFLILRYILPLLIKK